MWVSLLLPTNASYGAAAVQRVPRARMAAASHQTWQAVASASGGEGDSNRPCQFGRIRITQRHSEVRGEEGEEVGRDEKIENPEMVILCSGVLGRV